MYTTGGYLDAVYSKKPSGSLDTGYTSHRLEEDTFLWFGLCSYVIYN